MKKVFTRLVLMVTPIVALAQGTISIGNSGSGLVQQLISPSGPTTPASSGMVQFFAAPAGLALKPLGRFNGLRFELNFSSSEAFLAANPGWKAYETVAIGPRPGQFVGSTVTVSNIPPGGRIGYFTIGWTDFASLDAAIASHAAYIGESDPISLLATGDPTTTPPGPPAVMSASYPGMTLSQFCLDGYFWGFTAQPTSQTAAVGATAIFYAGALACPRPNYQWYFNGLSVPGATNPTIQIPNVQLSNAGIYWAIVTNAAWRSPYSGSVFVSSNAILTVVGELTSVTSPPQSQTAYVGSTVDFRASAAGSAPLAYEWFFNTTQALPGGTNPVLQLTNVQPRQAGAYTVVVTNAVGGVTSPPAMLSVIPPFGQRMVPGLSLLGQLGSLLNLENADALGPAPPWVTLDSVILTNTIQWHFDVSEPLPPQRFYRAWQTNGPGAIPTLRLYMVPATTLTGAIGHSVRLDYINQFGPTDAWVTLATVTLTNTSQLYFDTSARGQPNRLYRVVPLP